VFLLRKFLYHPVVNAMNEREAKITARLNEAEEKRKEAERQNVENEKKKQELIDQRAQKLEEINQEIQEQRSELMQKARDQVKSIQQNWEKDIKREQNEFLNNLRKTMNMEIFSILQKIMKDMANASLETEIIKTFGQKVKQVSEAEKEQISEAFSENESHIEIESAFDLSPTEKETVSDMIRKNLLNDKEVQFEFNKSKDLIAGIELHIHNFYLSWTIADYLDQLQEKIRREMDNLAHEEIEKNKNRSKD
jgi:F-type H+-transporting ATPase subunit b